MTQAWTWLASLMAAVAFFQSFQNIVKAVFPTELRSAASKLLHRLFHCLSPYVYFDITEIDGVSSNVLYSAAMEYLSSSASVACNRLSVFRAINSSAFNFGLPNNGELVDTYNGATVTWQHIATPRQQTNVSFHSVSDEKRKFTLRIRKQDKPAILYPYLNHIVDGAANLRHRNKDRLLYTNSRCREHHSPWESVPFKHPSTFDTLAIDPLQKEMILSDLRCFIDGKSFYQKTGRAWKRGYLLYGPPGTGKSSMIAAMSNYLGYDIYDLELTEVSTNSELRKLLMKTTSKSIIVIEDIDCSINFSNRQKLPSAPTKSDKDTVVKSITLSGLLNFTDGLWSCCGSERIFVFTTNHVEKLDPALLRSGRMDMHINLGYCEFPALKILMGNYWGLGDGDVLDDELMRELEKVVVEAEITPADVSEILIKKCQQEKGDAVRELVEVLRLRVEGRRAMAASVQMEDAEEQERRASESLEEECGEATEMGGSRRGRTMSSTNLNSPSLG